jgi:acetyl-CoA carboxylase biotin carboxyl carrier protein
MTERNLSYEDLMQIVELVCTTSQFSEFRLKIGDIEVSLKRANGAVRPAPMPQETPVREQAPAARREKEQVSYSADLHLVRSPMVGTFYRAAAPDQPPFVEVGQSVEPDSIVCIIEVMKLMNSIEAGVHGTVRQVVVENAAAVEAGEVLVAIEPLA